MTAPAEPATPAVEADPTPAAPAAPSPALMPQTDPAQAAAEPNDGADDGQPEVSTAEAKLRKENASWRTKLRKQEEAAAEALKTAQEREAEAASLKEILGKLNQVLNPDANPEADPSKVAEQLTEKLAAAEAQREKDVAERDQRIRDLTIRASLPDVVRKANADPDSTVDYLTASGALAKLDPASDTFTEDLESAVAAALEARPRLKIAPVATRSGAPIPGRSGGADQLTHEQVKEMSKKDPAALVKAQKEGRLRSLGINPS